MYLYNANVPLPYRLNTEHSQKFLYLSSKQAGPIWSWLIAALKSAVIEEWTTQQSTTPNCANNDQYSKYSFKLKVDS